MKPATLRQNGYQMSTISVAFNVGEHELIAAAATLWEEEDVELNVSKARIESALRKRLHDKGVDGLVYWSDDMDDDEVDKITEWATGQVKRLWPELFTQSKVTAD